MQYRGLRKRIRKREQWSHGDFAAATRAAECTHAAAPEQFALPLRVTRLDGGFERPRERPDVIIERHYPMAHPAHDVVVVRGVDSDLDPLAEKGAKIDSQQFFPSTFKNGVGLLHERQRVEWRPNGVGHFRQRGIVGDTFRPE
jgi:hypothetical protein